MHLQYFEKGITISDRVQEMIQKKIARLVRYCKRLKDEASFIHVEAERRETKKDRDAVKVALTVSLPRKVLRAESRRDSALLAAERCIEKLEPQLLEYKERRTGRQKAHVRARRAV